MAGALHIADAVVTGASLRGQHGDETEIQVGAGAVITPTGWDYIRDHRLRLTRGQGAAGQNTPAREATPPVATRASGTASSQVREIKPPSADGTSIQAQGRCDFPDQAYGCKTDEFGSGYASVGADEGEDFETLVQRITDHIMERLSGT